MHLHRSLTDGRRYFNRADLTPLPDSVMPEKLQEPDRVMLLSRLTPYQRIHALRNCLDRDQKAVDFQPWTQVWVGTREAQVCIGCGGQRDGTAGGVEG